MKRNTIIVLVVIAVIVLIFGGSTIGTYNGMVIKKQAVSASLSDIDSQLKRRMDLIPNLVNTVKAFAAQEKSIFDDVSANTAKLAGASTVADKATASDQLSGSLNRLIAIQQNYPLLKSDVNFRQLADELAGTENRINNARLDYNNAVQAYNTTIKSFPNNICAGIFGFKEAEYFKAANIVNEVPSTSGLLQ
jgi:LemA protein